jgi:hypothetical protein
MSAPSTSSAPPAPASQAGLESVALLLLSLATVGTAWCSYQATTWGAAAQRQINQSVAASRLAATDQLRAAQITTVDVLLFSQYIDARAASNEVLARFYSDRFRNEAKVAFTAWLSTRPFENADAPLHPFVTNLYHPQLLVAAAVAEGEAAKLAQQAGESGRTSRAYVLVTVLLATALFCGGTATKFNTNLIRRAVLGLGVAAFCYASARLVLLPIQM